MGERTDPLVFTIAIQLAYLHIIRPHQGDDMIDLRLHFRTLVKHTPFQYLILVKLTWLIYQTYVKFISSSDRANLLRVYILSTKAEAARRMWYAE